MPPPQGDCRPSSDERLTGGRGTPLLEHAPQRCQGGLALSVLFRIVQRQGLIGIPGAQRLQEPPFTELSSRVGRHSELQRGLWTNAPVIGPLALGSAVQV